MSKDKQSLYEDFHASTLSQKKLINENNFTYSIILRTLNKYLKSDLDVLDIGCGAGTLALYCASKTRSVLGTDISKSAVDAANRSVKELKLKNVSFQYSNFPSKIPHGKYDLIIFTEVIEHLENDKLALAQLRKLLKKNGLVILSTPSSNAPLFKLGLADEFDRKVGHLRRYDFEKLRVLCKSSGFQIIESYKTEGLIRNSLFILPHFGNLIRVVKWKLVDIVSFLDNISLKLFGESQLFLILKKS